MSLHDYAKRELDRLCPPDANGIKDELQEWIDRNVLQIVDLFSDQGHSNTSAMYVLNILERVLRFHPLTPLTGEDDEWVACLGQEDDKQQNNRYYSVFRNNHDNSTAYDIEGKIFSSDGGRTFWTSKDSRVPITFPFTVPKCPEKVLLKEGEVGVTNRDKVIKGLKHCSEDGCKDCPYETDCTTTTGFTDLAKDVLELLKEQEPKAVKIKKNAYNHEFYYCPRCDRGFEDFFRKPMFCDKCGQAVKWDA